MTHTRAAQPIAAAAAMTRHDRLLNAASRVLTERRSSPTPLVTACHLAGS
jgi:hypothetical protein